MTRIVEALLQFNGLTDRANQIIEEIDWDLLLPGCDADLAAANWHNQMMEIMQACIPQQTLTKRRNVPKNDSFYSVPPLHYQVLQPTQAMKTPLPGRMFKGIANSIAPSLSKLYNISFRLGCFPNSWKTSSVVPIPKNSHF